MGSVHIIDHTEIEACKQTHIYSTPGNVHIMAIDQGMKGYIEIAIRKGKQYRKQGTSLQQTT